MKTAILFLVVVCLPAVIAGNIASASHSSAAKKEKPFDNHSSFLEQLEHDTFNFFWETTNPRNGLTPDRVPGDELSSVAGVGFALSAYLAGAERNYISRSEAAERCLTTLRFLWEAKQDASHRGAIGYKGFFYHFLDTESGCRYGDSELSTIDTALLMAGVLSAQSYFDADDPVEARIRDYADRLYRRIDWPWLYSEEHKPLLSMGWQPESGFLESYWRGYNEGMILYLLALGSPTHPIAPDSWRKYTSTYDWKTFYDHSYVNFGPLFGYQYSQIWVDFRGIQDDFMRSRKSDYFINSRKATYANRAYCVANPKGFQGYGDNIWGLTACDGPGEDAGTPGDAGKPFYDYLARGCSADYLRDDGTIAPTAAGGSIPFAPEITIPALAHFKSQFGSRLYGKYGFRDAFNLSRRNGGADPDGWFDSHYLAIDQGPIVLMIENFRSGLIWDLMKKSPYIKEGLKRAGFTGGWLETG